MTLSLLRSESQRLATTSDVSDDFFGIMEEVANGGYCSTIAEKLGLKESHVELVQYLLCNGDHSDYGTSPRGCWLTEKGKAVYEQLKSLRPSVQNASHQKTR